MDPLGLGDRDDDLGHVLVQPLHVLLRGLVPLAQDDVGHDRLAGGGVVGSHHRRFRHRVVIDQGRLHLDRRDPVAADVHDVVHPSPQPEVAVVVGLAAVADEIDRLGIALSAPALVGEAGPVGLPKRSWSL